MKNSRRGYSRGRGQGRSQSRGFGPGAARGMGGGGFPGRDPGRDRRPPFGLYRSRNGVLFGVCRGMANYFGFSVFALRFFVFVVIMVTGLWPGLFIYLVAALVMKPEPMVQPADDDQREFYDSYASSRTLAIRRLKEKFDRLDKRIRRMEDHVTSRDYQWKRDFNS